MLQQWIDTAKEFLQTLPFIIGMNFLFTTLFFILSISFIGFILFLRLRKIVRDKKKKLLAIEISQFINENIFGELMSKDQIVYFRNVTLKKTLAKNIAIKQFLIYSENFKGETLQQLRALFTELHLEHYLYRIIKKNRWPEQTRALYVLSEIGIENYSLIKPFLKSKREELREQAIFYFIKTAKEDPLFFLDELDEELNLWEQIYIEDSLRNFYKGEKPNFSKWLQHPLNSVVLFSIRMIQKCNQFENIPKLIPFLSHEESTIRKTTVVALKKLSCNTLIELVIPRFKNEVEEVQKEILLAVKTLGEPSDLMRIKPFIDNCSKEMQTNYLRLEAI